jgi:hypothetical protein
LRLRGNWLGSRRKSKSKVYEAGKKICLGHHHTKQPHSEVDHDLSVKNLNVYTVGWRNIHACAANIPAKLLEAYWIIPLAGAVIVSVVLSQMLVDWIHWQPSALPAGIVDRLLCQSRLVEAVSRTTRTFNCGLRASVRSDSDHKVLTRITYSRALFVGKPRKASSNTSKLIELINKRRAALAGDFHDLPQRYGAWLRIQICEHFYVLYKFLVLGVRNSEISFRQNRNRILYSFRAAEKIQNFCLHSRAASWEFGKSFLAIE